MPEWISNIYQALTTQRLEVEALKAQQVELTQLVAELHETRAALAQANSLNVDLQNQINTLQAQLDQQPLSPNTTVAHDDIDMTDQSQGTLASKHANSDYVPLPRQVHTMKASYSKMAQNQKYGVFNDDELQEIESFREKKLPTMPIKLRDLSQ
jgi:hypothetical protein